MVQGEVLLMAEVISAKGRTCTAVHVLLLSEQTKVTETTTYRNRNRIEQAAGEIKTSWLLSTTQSTDLDEFARTRDRFCSARAPYS